MVTRMNGSITCGSFSAMPISGTVEKAVWEITCNWLDGWMQEVICSEREVAEIIMKLQAEYRKEKAS